MGKINVAIIGVGNCASSLVQGVHFYRTPSDEEVDPRAHARQPRRLSHQRHQLRRRLRHRQEQGRQGPVGGHLHAAEQHLQVRDVPHDGRARAPRHDPRRPGQVPLARSSRRRPARPPTSSASCRDTKTDVVLNYLPVGSEEATKWYVEQVLDAGCGLVNCIPVFIAREHVLAEALRGARPAHHRRRHQVAGRRHDRPPRADPALPRPRRPPRPHLPAQLRRQHRLPEHAGARAPGVEEDLQDQRRHLAARLRAARRRHPRRPQRLRAVAARPQVVLHPHGRHDLRQRAAEPGAEAGGLGQPQLRRRGHRRHPLLQAGAGPRHHGRRSSGPRPTS